MYDCGKFKVGDGQGKRYEVRFRQEDGSREEPFGWTDNEEAAQSMTCAISKHPCWTGARIIDREQDRTTCVDCGEWHDHPTSDKCDGCRFAGY